MRFAYRPYATDPSPADPSLVSYRPELKVRVAGPGGGGDEDIVWGILDTGAVDCILPYQYADGIKPVWCGTGAIGDYAGGSHPVEYGRVSLQIRTAKHRIRWPAIVAFRRQRVHTALWGRCGFLNHFRVTYHGPRRLFILRLRTPIPTGFAVEALPRRRHPGGSGLILPTDQDP